MRYLLFLLLSASVALGATDYYVDAGRTSNGDGSEANPWKTFANITWSTVASAAASGPVNIYLSSRAVWDTTANNTIGASGRSSTERVRLIGDEKYNLTASGTAVWSAESTGSRAVLTNSAGSGGGGIYITNNSTNIVVAGIVVTKSAFGAFQIGPQNPATNISYITLTNCYAQSPAANHGIWMGYAEADVHDILISGCTVTNTQSEAIYMGHFDYMVDTITNVVVEDCLVVDTGLTVEGDIDIKPGVYGAIVRRNRAYRQNNLSSGSFVGIACYADNAQIYSNVVARADENASSSWGVGIYLTADGKDSSNGKAVTAGKIFGNVVFGCDRHGIKLSATTPTSGANMSGVEIYNNTVFGNGLYGFEAATSNGKTITVDVFRDNLIASNTVYEIGYGSGVTISSANYNLIIGTNSTPVSYNGTARTYAQWQGLGFDANGVNADPLFTDAGAEDFTLAAGSPAIGAGTSGGDIGALNYVAPEGPGQTYNAATGGIRFGRLR